MEKRKRKMVGRLDTSNHKPKWHKTIYLENGKLLETIHDGEFSPFPSSSGLVFVPAQFCGEIVGMKGDSHNPTRYVENGENCLATAFISKVEQQVSAVDIVLDDNQYQASMKSRVVINDSTMSDYSQAFQAYLEQYKGTSQIVVAATELESALENGSHTIKVEYNGEESETMTFTVVPDYLYFEAAQNNSTVSMMSTMATAPNLEYSTDGETWQEWQHTTTTEDEETIHTFDTLTLTAAGDRVYLRGDNPDGFTDIDNEAFSLFSLTGKIAAHGNAQSLVDGDTLTLVAKTMPIFSDYLITEQPSDVLVSAPALPATTLAAYCYNVMFAGCTGLTQAPALPATTLAEGCYYGMFSGCTGLTQAPSLPTTTLADYCYSGMFIGCTGLTQAPSLPATTLAERCYYGMFSGCTGLTQAPSLPATTLAERCYYGMFSGCTFAMSSDGTTFNFAFGATPPVTDGAESFNTYYDIAVWMDNTNGFTTP